MVMKNNTDKVIMDRCNTTFMTNVSETENSNQI